VLTRDQVEVAPLLRPWRMRSERVIGGGGSDIFTGFGLFIASFQLRSPDFGRVCRGYIDRSYCSSSCNGNDYPPLSILNEPLSGEESAETVAERISRFHLLSASIYSDGMAPFHTVCRTRRDGSYPFHREAARLLIK
jgi:hypothetical protein